MSRTPSTYNEGHANRPALEQTRKQSKAQIQETDTDFLSKISTHPLNDEP